MKQFNSIWRSSEEQQKKVLRLYSPESELIYLSFNPLKISHEPHWNPQWEQWHCYYQSLYVYKQDYTQLLLPYFDQIYPTKDAFDGTVEPCFDVCFYNWICKEDWQKIIDAIEKDLDTFSDIVKKFYIVFLEWIKKALCYTTIIVVEGNQ